MSWKFEGKEFTSDDIGDHVDFVYLVRDIETGKKYIGKKQFHSHRSLPPLKGKTRRRKVVTESDWQTYCGSNETIKAIVAGCGIDRFERTILHLCVSKSEMSYRELLEQIERNVLFDDEYLNGIINVRINAKHIRDIAQA